MNKGLIRLTLVVALAAALGACGDATTTPGSTSPSPDASGTTTPPVSSPSPKATPTTSPAPAPKKTP
ncbi:serine protease [Microcoleus sp. AT3-A2]|uniref:serine protease n=1 Tax=unclassified Microcoleus TaxID=2642155 RepID=UPI002FD672DF